MADKPKLIGIIRIPVPHVTREVEPGVSEMIQHVAFDERGVAWGLVQRLTKIDGGPQFRPRLGRLTLHRFQRLNDITFDDKAVGGVFEGEFPVPEVY